VGDRFSGFINRQDARGVRLRGRRGAWCGKVLTIVYPALAGIGSIVAFSQNVRFASSASTLILAS